MKYFKMIFHPYLFILDVLYWISDKEIIKLDYYKNTLEKQFSILRLNYLLKYNYAFRSIFKFRCIKTHPKLTNFLFKFFPTLKTIEIGYNSQIDAGFVIKHNVSVISCYSAGKNFFVGPMVVIGLGTENKEDKRRLPKFGDNVFVFAHSTVVGGITIGNNVVIGAHTMVNKDIPDDCMVVGNPFRIIKKFNREKQKWENINEEGD